MNEGQSHPYLGLDEASGSFVRQIHVTSPALSRSNCMARDCSSFEGSKLGYSLHPALLGMKDGYIAHLFRPETTGSSQTSYCSSRTPLRLALCISFLFAENLFPVIMHAAAFVLSFIALFTVFSRELFLFLVMFNFNQC